MADVKFSQFPAASAITNADQFAGLQGGLNVRFSGLQINSFIQIAPSQVNGIAITQTGNTNLLPQGTLNFYLTTTGGATDNLIGMPNFDALSTRVDGALFAVNNLSDLANATTATANLGLLNGYNGFGDLDYTLTNPMPTLWQIFTTAAGHFIQLAPANQSTSIQAGRIITAQHVGSAAIELRNAVGFLLTTLQPGHFYKIELVSNSVPAGSYIIVEETASVNGFSGAVVLTGNDINSTYTPSNYTPTNSTIDGNLAGIDAALGGISADVSLQDAYNNGQTIQLNGGQPLLISNSSTVPIFDIFDGGVSVGNGSLAASAIFDVFSTTKGSRPFPSMTTSQRNAIASPATGLMIYNTNTSTIDLYNGSAWINASSNAVTLQEAYDNGNSITLDGTHSLLVNSSASIQVFNTTDDGTQSHHPVVNASGTVNVVPSNIDSIFVNDPSIVTDIKIQVEPGTTYANFSSFYAFRGNASAMTVTAPPGVTINGVDSAVIDLSLLDAILFIRMASNTWQANTASAKPSFQDIYNNSPSAVPDNINFTTDKPLVFIDSHGNQFFSAGDDGVSSSKPLYPLLANDTISYDNIGKVVLNTTGSSLDFSLVTNATTAFSDGTEVDILIYQDPVVFKIPAGVEVNGHSSVSSYFYTFSTPFQLIGIKQIDIDKWAFTVSEPVTNSTFAYGTYHIAGNGDPTTFTGIGSPSPININSGSFKSDSSSLINFEVTNPGTGIYGLKYMGADPALVEIDCELTLLSDNLTAINYTILFGYESGSGITPDTLNVSRQATVNSFLFANVSLLATLIINPGDEVYVMAAPGDTGSPSNEVTTQSGYFRIQTVLPDVLLPAATSAVLSVNGDTGIVVLDTDNIDQGFNNIYASNDGGATDNLANMPTIKQITGATPISGTSATIQMGQTYICTNASLTTLTLPTTFAVGNQVRVIGAGSGLVKIAQNSGQTIHMGTSSSTTGVTGYAQTLDANGGLSLIASAANTDLIVAPAPQGNVNLV